jgi:RNA recognition motif. (a.k.a. RRM, RBD, or RNP domain)
VVDQEIIRDHETNRSRGFGFVVFETEEAVEALLSKGSIIELDGVKVQNLLSIMIRLVKYYMLK